MKVENTELVCQIEQVKEENDSLLLDVSNFEKEIDGLEVELKKAKNRKEKIVERVEYIEVTNDTIADLMLLNRTNDTIIRNLEKISLVKDSIILDQKIVIQNDTDVIQRMRDELDNRRDQLMQMNKELRMEEKKKMFWQVTTAGLGIVLIGVLL